MATPVIVVGGGLAGCEAALQLAGRGHPVRLLEMRPVVRTPAHQTDLLGELVCTNSFKSEDPANAHGQLKREMDRLGSLLLTSAREARVPAGSALAVDRDLFASAMTRAVARHPRIELVREEGTDLPDGPAIVATGPARGGEPRLLRRHRADRGEGVHRRIRGLRSRTFRRGRRLPQLSDEPGGVRSVHRRSARGRRLPGP